MPANIHDLPFELLSHIFLWGKRLVDTAILDSSLDTYGDSRQPLFEDEISQTCMRFRQIAFASPRLWTTINVDPTTSLDRLTTRIRLSGARALDVTVVDQGHSHPGGSFIEAVQLLVECSARWGSLTMACSENDSQNSWVNRLCEATAPRLRHLSISVDHTVSTVAQREAIHNTSSPHIFHNPTPRLDFVRLRATALFYSRPNLASTTILHLDQNVLTPLRYETVRSIINSATSLLHLSVFGDIVQPSSWTMRSNEFQLPHLLSLRICAASAKTYSGLLLGIEAPSLNSLTLKDLHERDLQPLFDAATDGRFSQLRSLTFYDFEFRPSTYTRVFQLFTGVESFHSFHCTAEQSQLLGILGNLADGEMTRQVGDMPWPRLKTISFLAGPSRQDEGIIRLLEKSPHPFFQQPEQSRVLRRVNREDLSVRRARAVGQTGGEKMGVKMEVVCATEVWPEGSVVFDSGDDLFL